jgi:hypothetical protein
MRLIGELLLVLYCRLGNFASSALESMAAETMRSLAVVARDRYWHRRDGVLSTPERGGGIWVQQQSGDDIAAPPHGTLGMLRTAEQPSAPWRLELEWMQHLDTNPLTMHTAHYETR